MAENYNNDTAQGQLGFEGATSAYHEAENTMVERVSGNLFNAGKTNFVRCFPFLQPGAFQHKGRQNVCYLKESKFENPRLLISTLNHPVQRGKGDNI